MSEIFIIGAAGKVGSRLVPLLVGAGHDVRALYRKSEQAQRLSDAGAKVVQGDITQLDAAHLAELAAGCDAIVFTAGAGGAGIEMTNAVDGRGLERAVDAARGANVPRFILVSAFPEASRTKDTSESLENYLRVKKASEAHLAATDLDWVILRAGRLTDDAGTGRINAAQAVVSAPVTRDDVAAVLVEIINRPALMRIIVELTNGDRTIGEALEHLERKT